MPLNKLRELAFESLLTILRNPKADIYGRGKSDAHRPDNCVERKKTGRTGCRLGHRGRRRTTSPNRSFETAKTARRQGSNWRYPSASMAARIKSYIGSNAIYQNYYLRPVGRRIEEYPQCSARHSGTLAETNKGTTQWCAHNARN